MKILKIIFLVFWFFVCTACKDLPFTDADDQSTSTVDEKEQTENDNQLFVEKEKALSKTADAENVPSVENEAKPSDEIPAEQITIISKFFNLTEDTIIQNKKVILDMVEIKTFEHDLFIMADEFVSHHAVIQNFSTGKSANRGQSGKNGGNIQIKAKTVTGTLKLVLNGEDGGYVGTRKLSNREKYNLIGQNGKNGYHAEYRRICEKFRVLWIPVDQDCWLICGAPPTRGENGEYGRKGLRGFKGKNGGSSGSFQLTAYNLSDFHLTEVQNEPGKGSKGGKGSLGGKGGRAGKNGRDKRNICKHKLSRPRDGKRGKRGERGEWGQNGRKGSVCLEQLIENLPPQEESKPAQSFKNDEEQDVKVNSQEKENVICY